MPAVIPARGRARGAARWLALVLVPGLFTPLSLGAQHEHHHGVDAVPLVPAGRRQPPARDAIILSARQETGGVRVGFQLARPQGVTVGGVVEGRDTDVWISLEDSTAQPLSRAVLGVWMARRASAARTSDTECRDKVESYLREAGGGHGSLQNRAEVDLNSYFVLALNRGNTISVIDPFLGFGSSKLYTMVRLPSQGEDWLLDDEARRLYVTLPLLNQLAVVRTDDWKIDTLVAVGSRPLHVVRQPGSGRLWVVDGAIGNGPSGVTVLDPATLAIVARQVTGAGAHGFTFSPDGRLAFVTNPLDGTVTVLDGETAAVRGQVETGGQGPGPVAYSAVARAAFVAHVGEGGIVAIDPAALRVGGRYAAPAGFAALAFEPSGRWGIGVNQATDSIFVVDAAAGRIRHRMEFGRAPDQVSFTPSFAYVRSTGSADVGMIPLEDLGSEGRVRTQNFPAGGTAPGEAGGMGSATAIADAMASDPHMMDAVYVPNPAEASIYYYHYMEGMPTPSGRLGNYGFRPRAVLVAGRDLREQQPGWYGTTIRAPDAGRYDLIFLLDRPRLIHCFGFEVAADSARAAARGQRLTLEPLWQPADLVAGDTLTLRFRLKTAGGGEPRSSLTDLRVLLSTPAGWSERLPATEVEAGVYQVRTSIPAAGAVYLVTYSRQFTGGARSAPGATLLVRSR